MNESPAGWYDDPEGKGLRYWDGGHWTEYRSVRQSREDPPLLVGAIGLTMVVMAFLLVAAIIYVFGG